MDGYVPERRAIRLVADGAADVKLKLTPNGSCVSPVIELDAAPAELISVSLNGQLLEKKKYAWDGRVLWVIGVFAKPVTIALRFDIK
ncbi:MAG: hypothetical protein ACR2H1_05670 [Limisphaerales bacterium]